MVVWTGGRSTQVAASVAGANVTGARAEAPAESKPKKKHVIWGVRKQDARPSSTCSTTTSTMTAHNALWAVSASDAAAQDAACTRAARRTVHSIR